MSQKTKDATDAKTKLSSANIVLMLFCALLITYLASTLPLPYKVAAPVLAIPAVVLGIMALRRTAQAKNSMFLPFAALVGLLGSLFFGAVASAQIAFWGPTQEYETCVSQAITDRAFNQCNSNYSEQLGVD